ncbi:MAG TPA: hypothetical protein DD435_07585 [Cyanobacteria bacterium UBA8530]|nr:hypothetical protein [Cyanobacteria bacterium UBA8530]
MRSCSAWGFRQSSRAACHQRRAWAPIPLFSKTPPNSSFARPTKGDWGKRKRKRKYSVTAE